MDAARAYPPYQRAAPVLDLRHILRRKCKDLADKLLKNGIEPQANKATGFSQSHKGRGEEIVGHVALLALASITTQVNAKNGKPAE